MQVGAPVELARLLLGVQRPAEGVGGLVEVRRREIGGEGVHRAEREAVAFARGDEAAGVAVGVHRLAAVLLEGDAGEGEARTHVAAQGRTVLPALVGLLHLGVRGERVEELLGDQAMDAGHALALEVVLQVALDVEALLLDVGVGVAKVEVDHLRGDAELLVQVVERGAVGVQDHALERPHAQMLEGDGVLVAHGLQMLGHHLGEGLHLGLGAEGAHALDLLGQHHVVVGDVRDGEGAKGPLAALAHGARGAHRQGRQQGQHAVLLLHRDGAEAHRLLGHQAHLLQPAVVVG